MTGVARGNNGHNKQADDIAKAAYGKGVTETGESVQKCRKVGDSNYQFGNAVFSRHPILPGSEEGYWLRDPDRFRDTGPGVRDPPRHR